ncbi:MAG: DEAD/DEAH box helicase [Fibrobacteria bacterium]|nr:DEAD/DEAH box helicase [Fibrobacteria bacterium]
MHKSEKASTSWHRLGLPPVIMKAITRAGFTRPTPVQLKTIPLAIKDKSFFAVAPAGTGKTLAYLIPAWCCLKATGTRICILTPTRELAYQVSQMLRKLSPDLPELCRVFVGGRDVKTDINSIQRDNWKVLIATPGRFIDVFTQYPKALSMVNIQVLDEFDKLLKLGFREQIEQIRNMLPKKHRTWMFSATEPDEYVNEHYPKIQHIHIADHREKPSCTEQIYYLNTPKTKSRLCIEALKKMNGQTILFVKNREKANHLNGLLKLNKIECHMLHGKLKQGDRAQIFQKLIEGKIKILVATDIAGRGLDTLSLDMIINYSLPLTVEDYIHRKGRAGRLGRPGKCITFASPDEYIPMKKLQDGLDYEIPPHPDYAKKEKWFLSARAKHKKKSRREERIEEIKEKQSRDS